mgnify:CR=1 FL=1
MRDLVYESDSDFHICLLKSRVSGTEGLIDLGLDVFCLINQLHHSRIRILRFLSISS